MLRDAVNTAHETGGAPPQPCVTVPLCRASPREQPPLGYHDAFRPAGHALPLRPVAQSTPSLGFELQLDGRPRRLKQVSGTTLDAGFVDDPDTLLASVGLVDRLGANGALDVGIWVVGGNLVHDAFVAPVMFALAAGIALIIRRPWRTARRRTRRERVRRRACVSGARAASAESRTTPASCPSTTTRPSPPCSRSSVPPSRCGTAYSSSPMSNSPAGSALVTASVTVGPVLPHATVSDAPTNSTVNALHHTSTVHGPGPIWVPPTSSIAPSLRPTPTRTTSTTRHTTFRSSASRGDPRLRSGDRYPLWARLCRARACCCTARRGTLLLARRLAQGDEP